MYWLESLSVRQGVVGLNPTIATSSRKALLLKTVFSFFFKFGSNNFLGGVLVSIEGFETPNTRFTNWSGQNKIRTETTHARPYVQAPHAPVVIDEGGRNSKEF